MSLSKIKDIENNMNKKIVVYTAIFDNYDPLWSPKYKSESCDYVCFSDNQKLRTKTWTLAQLSSEHLPPALLNRKVKILPHLYFPDYEYSIYIDGNIEIIGDMEELVNKYIKDNLMACSQHQKRNCIYEEAEKCIELGKGDAHRIRRQMLNYRKVGYPKNFGLTDNSILLRRHNEPAVVKVMEDWWSELQNGSMRDQLSFNFVAWKHNFKYIFMKDSVRKTNPYFRLHSHTPHGHKGSFWRHWVHIKANRDRSAICALLFYVLKRPARIAKAVAKRVFESK